MVRPWSAKPLSHFRKAYPSTTISASSVFFYFCLFFQRIRRDVPLHYAESTEKALAALFYVQLEINGMKYFACFLHIGALRGVPARRGSGQATKRREAALLAGRFAERLAWERGEDFPLLLSLECFILNFQIAFLKLHSDFCCFCHRYCLEINSTEDCPFLCA